MTSLGELREELSAMTGVEPTGKVNSLARDLPVLHCCGDPERLLDDNSLTPRPGSRNRADLGLDGYTFFWVGRCAYDHSPLVLVWAPEAERALPDGRGSPWDTGGLLSKGTLGQKVTFDEALAAIERYSLPLADYRDYLSLVIETCFREPTDYLRLEGQPHWYPGCRPPPIRPAGLPARTFETRREGPVDIAEGLVAVVPDESRFVDTPRLLRKLRSFASTAEAQWITPRAGESAQLAAARFVVDFMRVRGAV